MAVIAIGCVILLWRGSRKNSQTTLLGLWTPIASYMSRSAGRFIINATPAMAVVGGMESNAVECSKPANIFQGFEELGNRHPDSFQVSMANN